MAAPTIFVVDDDEAVRDSLRVLLESHGMAVEVHASTETFARSYRPRQRGCLIPDQHLQGSKTGLDFLDSAEWVAMGLPVILITGGGNADIRARAAQVGAVACLDKPLEVGGLVAMIGHALAAGD